jgi:hypothetical protein
VHCILPQSQTTPEKTLSNPWFGKGFCEPHQYKAAIDRCEGGYRSCELGIDMYKDLAKLLESHATAIRHWSTSSQKHIIQSKEFGTNRKSWIESVRAVEKIAERNDDIATSIHQNVVEKMVAYKTNHYVKSFIHVKSIKQYEKEFKKVQKSWLELLDKINDAKQAFHEAQRKLQHAEDSENVTKTDVGSSDELKKKLKTSVDHRKTDTDTCRKRYSKLIDEMKEKQPIYEEDMFKILKKTDDFEEERLAHFRLMFTALQVATSTTNDTRHAEMHKAFEVAINGQNISDDIAYFNKHYGRETKTKWPVFEELTE